MFAGHLGAALVAKSVEPRPSLSAYVAAAYGLDMLWPLFLLAGIETVRIEPGATAFTPLAFVSYPWSHSLLLSVIWATLAAVLTARFLKARRAAPVLGFIVISHWLLDWITHVPDLPLWPGGPVEGLGLWRSLLATFVVEGAVFAAAIAVYVRRVPARDAAGRWSFVGLVALVAAIWTSSPFSPPPPGTGAIVAVGLAAAALLPAWAAHIDRHRGPRRR
jgi:membrane-bound metal-dependent hydrolase YbcI (DUF457 family)